MKKYNSRNSYRPNYNSRTGFSSKKSPVGKIVTVAASIVAVCLIFFSGAIIGNIPMVKNLFNHNNSSKVPTQTSSQSASSNSSNVGSEGLGDDITLVKPTEQTSVLNSIKAITLDEVKSPSYIVIDRLSGQVVLEKNSKNKIYPSTITNVLTSALALDLVEDLSTVMTVKNPALSYLTYTASKMGVQNGEELAFEDLLYGTLLASGCDSANTIAINVSGYNDFVKKMNQKAKAIGCTNSYFVNPNGLYASSHFSTVSDIARIESYAQLNSTYREIIATEIYSAAATNVHTNEGWNIIKNDNILLGMDDLFSNSSNILKVTGAKIGYSENRSYSISCSAITKDGVELVAVMGGLPYNSGKGYNDLLVDIYSVLENAAKNVKATTKKDVLTYGELSSDLLGSVKNIIPLGVTLSTERGLSIVTKNGEVEPLANGEEPVFTTDFNFTTKAFYFDNIEEILNGLGNGEEKTVGYIELTLPNSNSLVENIAIVAKR